MGMVLKCDARLLKQPDRAFQLFFFLEDDTMQVYEQQVKNSGMNSAPNFLKRGKYEVPHTHTHTHTHPGPGPHHGLGPGPGTVHERKQTFAIGRARVRIALD